MELNRANLEEHISDIEDDAQYLFDLVELITDDSKSLEDAVCYFKHIVDSVDEHHRRDIILNLIMTALLDFLKNGQLTLDCLTYLLDKHPYLASSLHKSNSLVQAHISNRTPIEVSKILISYIDTEETLDTAIAILNLNSNPGNPIVASHEQKIMGLFEDHRQVIRRRGYKKPL
jgi:hypothetical protein